MSPSPRARLFAAAATLAALTAGGVARADTVVQIPLTGVLDARSVTTLTGGQLVVFTLPTDGGNLQNAYATKAVATKQGKPVANALPDDGKIPADARHPEVVLHFSNDADAASPQTHLIKTGDMMTFPVPSAVYSKLFLFFNGAAGGTNITVTLTYADGMEMQPAFIPDYYAGVTTANAVTFDLVVDLAKWDKNTAINEAGHHTITGAEFHPMAGKMLTGVTVSKDAMGNLVFWGATGVATTDVAVGGAGGTGGMSGAAGAAGAPGAGTGGASGAGGASTVGGASTSGAAGSPSAGAAGSSVGGGTPNGGSSAAGTATVSGGSFAMPPSTPASDAGCGCRLAASGSHSRDALWLLLGAAGALYFRRRQS
jgi:MYXO-CTERM domain-containing protein